MLVSALMIRATGFSSRQLLLHLSSSWSEGGFILAIEPGMSCCYSGCGASFFGSVTMVFSSEHVRDVGCATASGNIGSTAAGVAKNAYRLGA